MASATKPVKRGRPPVVRNETILRLAEMKRATRVQLGITPVYVTHLQGQGFITVAGQEEKDGTRGRPANIYRLTLAGQNVARSLKRAAEKAAKAEAAAVAA